MHWIPLSNSGTSLSVEKPHTFLTPRGFTAGSRETEIKFRDDALRIHNFYSIPKFCAVVLFLSYIEMA